MPSKSRLGRNPFKDESSQGLSKRKKKVVSKTAEASKKTAPASEDFDPSVFFKYGWYATRLWLKLITGILFWQTVWNMGKRLGRTT